MSEKDLIVKLNNLKNISPDNSWLKSNRELLLSQISNSGAKKISGRENFFINLSSFFKASAQPAYSFGVFVFILLFTSLFAHQLFSKTKPTDSLYIARIISEKAKLSTVINSESRDKLAMQFANERAQEISAVLSDPNFNNDSNKVEVAKLNNNFNEELATVKTKIKNLKPVAKVAKNNLASSSSDSFSIAENNKDTSGVQLFENPNNKVIVDSNKKVEAASALKSLNPSATLTLTVKATSTKIAATSSDIVSTNSIIDQAQKLFDNKDYSQASNKLKEVNSIIK